MIQIWKIDNNGFLIETRLIKEDEKTDSDITTGFSIGFVKPKWNGSKWVEGATNEEIQEHINTQEKITPSSNKIIAMLISENAEIKTQIANLISEIAEIKGGQN